MCDVNRKTYNMAQLGQLLETEEIKVFDMKDHCSILKYRFPTD